MKQILKSASIWILKHTFAVLLVAWVLFQEFVWVYVDKTIKAAMKFKPIQGLIQSFDKWIAKSHRFTVLSLFMVVLISFLIVEFVVGPYMMVTIGVLTAGVIGFPVKVILTGIATRIFTTGKDKMLSVGWFNWLYTKWIKINTWAHNFVHKTRLYQLIHPKIVGLKKSLKIRIYMIKKYFANRKEGEKIGAYLKRKAIAFERLQRRNARANETA